MFALTRALHRVATYTSRPSGMNTASFVALDYCRHSFASTSTWAERFKIAIIGSGPAGFYTAQQLLKHANVSVDIYEQFPVPFGLVRFGVAPDHQEVKNVVHSFTKVALNANTQFFGNVSIGKDVTLSELREAYNAVVLCYGSSQDTMLGIPGEDVDNVVSARRFVGWYNGIPQDKDLSVSLHCDTAAIIGQGNVALDCARILLLSPEALKNTDITSHAFRKLSHSKLKTIYIVGRRGPMQAAFKIKEFRELSKMQDCKVKIVWKEQDKAKLDFDQIAQDTSESRPRKRMAELYKRIIDESDLPHQHPKECRLEFFKSPVEIVPDAHTKRVKSIRFQHNHLDDYQSEHGKIIEASEDIDEIECGLVIRSIGYRSQPIDESIPFDYKRGVIINTEGRVANNADLYCSGWAAFGATGVILNTMTASFEVAKNILRDLEAGQLSHGQSKEGSHRIVPLLKARNATIVDFIDWQKIDQYEIELGRKEGKPREKLVNVKEIFNIKEIIKKCRRSDGKDNT